MGYSRIIKCLLLLSGTGLLSAAAQAQELNPNYFYLVKGELISRSIAVGDATNWYTPLQGREGQSAGGKVIVAPTNFKGKGDAIQITWASRKKLQGNFSLSGRPIDLSKFKDAASLTIDMRVDVKPDKNVTIGLDCGYPCRADLPINGLIKKMPKGEWFSLPLPLNCFKGDNFDLSKISGPFSIATDGKLTLSITNIRLEKLPDGEKGCVEE
ncbi:putative glycoside hydrolase [Cellvibrio sp. PSBB023]|uniref:putative glycoside hydrolase n=1 Tax=Cellvibrio sp. PSBB023 TaxID=1945512 RepID=UPI00098F75BE|nr:putative glycoside hydrolase [Cellvibrio sp. PSBB023]AQT60925.1 glucan-glucohydrolase [Cellvibrio sp. PSBB023]